MFCENRWHGKRCHQLKKCPMASTTPSEAPEKPSRTVMGEGKDFPGDWPPKSTDPRQTCPKPGFSQIRELVSAPLPAQILFAPPVQQLLLPGWVCCRAAEGLELPHPPCSAHPGLSMQPFFTACGNPLPPAPLVLQIKPPSNFGLGILLPAPPALSCLANGGDSVGPGAARGYKALSVGTGGHAHKQAVCLLPEPYSQFTMIFFPLCAQGKGGVDAPNPTLAGWLQLSCTQN